MRAEEAFPSQCRTSVFHLLIFPFLIPGPQSCCRWSRCAGSANWSSWDPSPRPSTPPPSLTTSCCAFWVQSPRLCPERQCTWIWIINFHFYILIHTINIVWMVCIFVPPVHVSIKTVIECHNLMLSFVLQMVFQEEILKNGGQAIVFPIHTQVRLQLKVLTWRIGRLGCEPGNVRGVTSTIPASE